VRALTSSPFVVMTKSSLLKCTCALGTQLMPRLAIRSLVVTSRRAKSPYLARQLSVFEINTNE
jgi:hypothetical protein